MPTPAVVSCLRIPTTTATAFTTRPGGRTHPMRVSAGPRVSGPGTGKGGY